MLEEEEEEEEESKGLFLALVEFEFLVSVFINS